MEKVGKMNDGCCQTAQTAQNAGPSKVTIKCVAQDGAALPEYQTKDSAGADIRAFLSEPVVIPAGGRSLIPTGLSFEIPSGYEVQVRPRSGLAIKNGITCLNAPGTIDADYRGEVGVILINLSQEPFEIQPGERIAQMVISKFVQAEFQEVAALEDLSDTERGAGGFGHSGKL